MPKVPPPPPPFPRTNLPPALPYSKYWLSRFCSKSSHQIQPGCGVAHSGAPDGAVTVTLAEPLLPSLVAVITAGPALTPLTSPFPSTVAATALSVVQSTVRPLNTLPFASRRVAVSCTVCPTATLAVGGLTVTVATGGAHTPAVPPAPLCAPAAVATDAPGTASAPP